MLTAEEALRRLRDGNERYVTDVLDPQFDISHGRRRELVDAQSPFAVILGCSDSRVPAEIVFDQGLGDLFVIRVAGNIVSPSQIGSVEFAAEKLGTTLVVVLGHTGCGAIDATLQTMTSGREQPSPGLRFIAEHIRPSIESLMEARSESIPQDLRARAVRANIRASAHHLRHGSEILETKILGKQLTVVGAEYDLATGRVDFFDGTEL